MVNPSGDQDANLTIKLYDLEANLIAENAISIAPGAHLPRFIRELLPEVKDQAANMQGIVTVMSDLPIAAVTLKQRNDPDQVFPGKIPTLTTFPVIRGIAE
jgi:hypothetical protein